MKKLFVPAVLFITLFVFSLGTAPAAPWHFELKSILPMDIMNGEIYLQEVIFHSNGPDRNLNVMFISVDYDETVLEFLGYNPVVYETSDFIPKLLWGPAISPGFDDSDPPGIVALNGSEPLGSPGVFFAGEDPGTLIGTLGYRALADASGIQLGVFAKNPIFADVVEVGGPLPPVGNGKNHQFPPFSPPDEPLDIRQGGAELTIVPIPGALLLLGSGLMGLAAIRKRFQG